MLYIVFLSCMGSTTAGLEDDGLLATIWHFCFQKEGKISYPVSSLPFLTSHILCFTDIINAGSFLCLIVKKDFSLKNMNLLNFDYSELVSRSKLHISSSFVRRGIWLVLLEPSKAFKKFKGHTCPETLTQDQPLCYSAETKPLAVEDRGGVRVMMLHYSGFQTNPFASLEW